MTLQPRTCCLLCRFNSAMHFVNPRFFIIDVGQTHGLLGCIRLVCIHWLSVVVNGKLNCGFNSIMNFPLKKKLSGKALATIFVLVRRFN